MSSLDMANIVFFMSTSWFSVMVIRRTRKFVPPRSSARNLPRSAQQTNKQSTHTQAHTEIIAVNLICFDNVKQSYSQCQLEVRKNIWPIKKLGALMRWHDYLSPLRGQTDRQTRLIYSAGLWCAEWKGLHIPLPVGRLRT